MLNWWNSNKRRGCAWACIVLAAVLAPTAGAEEITIKNDSIADFGEAVIVGDFDQGEHGGARLTSPCDGTIVAVQILWLEGTPGHPQSLEQAIHIYDSPGFPTPGAELETLLGPVMTPGYWNEFRYLDQAQTMPLEVPVTTGQEITVSLEFYNPTDVGNGGPSVVRDVDGCQSGRNLLYGDIGAGSQWYNFCLLIGGDIGIRMVVECPGVTGACCYATGICENEVEEADCQDFGAEWHEGLNCGEITCNPRGACCRMGGCLQLVDPATCAAIDGDYAGHGTNCDDDVCVAGACCIEDTGECVENFGFQCADLGEDFLGPGTTCDPNPCPQPIGACCIGTFCLEDQTQEDCEGAFGEWVGPWTDCGPPNPCDDACHIVSSDPQHGWIDARAPLFEGSPAGWSAVDITFNAECNASGLGTGDFAITEVCDPGNCDEVAPGAAGFAGSGNAGTLTLDRPLDPKAWTVISLVGGNAEDVIYLGFLPADSDASGFSNANDIVQVVDYVNDATAGGSPPWHSTNIDRSQYITANDIIELIDLLNGAGDYEAYFGATLPSLP